MEQERESTRLIELEPRLLVLFLFIVIPFTLVGCLFILGFVRSEMNEQIGRNLHGGAADTARYLDSYILHTVTHVSVLAATPSIRQTVATANRTYAAPPEEIRSELLARDSNWTRARGAIPLALDVVGDRASSFLREVASFNPSYQEVLVTDRQGALVAATNITTDYFQADETWWQKAFGDGERGAVFVSSVGFDQSAGAYVMEVAVPVREELGDGMTEVSGVMKVLVEARDLATVVGSVRAGAKGQALLVDASDGTVIVGSDPSDIMRREYGAVRQLEEALSEGRSSFVARLPDDDVWLAGFSRMPEPSPSPELDWIVVVQEPLEEANAAIRAATRYMVMFFAGMVLLILAFSLFMHFKLVRPIREIDLREEMDRLAGSRT